MQTNVSWQPRLGIITGAYLIRIGQPDLQFLLQEVLRCMISLVVDVHIRALNVWQTLKLYLELFGYIVG